MYINYLKTLFGVFTPYYKRCPEFELRPLYPAAYLTAAEQMYLQCKDIKNYCLFFRKKTYNYTMSLHGPKTVVLELNNKR